MRRRFCTGSLSFFPIPPAGVRFAVIVLFFLAGVLTGGYYGADSAAAYGAELSAYFADYAAASGDSVSFDPGYSLLCYFGFPVLVFTLGFSLLGTLLIPLSAGVFGYVTAFAVAALAVSFGKTGVRLAFSLMAVRLLFTLPTFFLIAQRAWPLSFELALAGIGQGKRTRPVTGGGAYLFVFFVCVVVLFAGILAERLITPLLIRFLWEG